MTTLSICIPTYKRPSMLERCIRSAVESAASRPIEIVVVDDSVSDVNRSVLDALTSEFPFVRVTVNETNLGIDRNIQKAVDLSQCDHAWLIGEDDVFLPSAIARVYDALQTASYPFIFSNYQYVSEDHREVVGVALPIDFSVSENVEPFVATTLWAVGFIGGCIVRTRDWRKTDPGAYDGTYFTHIGRILDMLNVDRRLLILSSPGVANRAQGDDTFTWKKDSFGVFLGFERMCRVAAARNPELRSCIEEAAVNYRAKFAYFSAKTAFRLRSQGAFDWRQYRKYVQPSDIELWRKAWFFMMAALPASALKPVANLYVSIAAKRNTGGPT